MDELDRVGVMVVVEGGLAAAASSTGVPELAASAGLAPMVDYYLARSVGRAKNVDRVIEQAISNVESSPSEFLDWIKADERHLTLFHGVVESAYATFEQERIETLGRVLADGYEDDARIDLDMLVVKALRDLDVPHIRVLQSIATTRNRGPKSLKVAFPFLREAIDPILTTLERHGCCEVDIVANAGDENRYGLLMPDSTEEIFGEAARYLITTFGQVCLNYIAGTDSSGLFDPWAHQS